MRGSEHDNNGLEPHENSGNQHTAHLINADELDPTLQLMSGCSTSEHRDPGQLSSSQHNSAVSSPYICSRQLCLGQRSPGVDTCSMCCGAREKDVEGVCLTPYCGNASVPGHDHCITCQRVVENHKQPNPDQGVIATNRTTEPTTGWVSSASPNTRRLCSGLPGCTVRSTRDTICSKCRRKMSSDKESGALLRKRLTGQLCDGMPWCKAFLREGTRCRDCSRKMENLLRPRCGV